MSLPYTGKYLFLAYYNIGRHFETPGSDSNPVGKKRGDFPPASFLPDYLTGGTGTEYITVINPQKVLPAGNHPAVCGQQLNRRLFTDSDVPFLRLYQHRRPPKK
jgi:hypothetical protein